MKAITQNVLDESSLLAMRSRKLYQSMLEVFLQVYPEYIGKDWRTQYRNMFFKEICV